MSDLNDSIRELEIEFHRRDAYNSGVISRSEFTFVLVRHGGMLTQIDALADRFSDPQATSTVDYRQFIVHMLSLANGVVSSEAKWVAPTRVTPERVGNNDAIAAASVAQNAILQSIDDQVDAGVKDDVAPVRVDAQKAFSLRDVFRKIARNANLSEGSRKLSLDVVFEGMRSAKIPGVSLPVLEAVCDSLKEDGDVNEKGFPLLTLEEFCVLVSRLPTNTIAVLRTKSTWESTRDSAQDECNVENTTRALVFDQFPSSSPTTEQKTIIDEQRAEVPATALHEGTAMQSVSQEIIECRQVVDSKRNRLEEDLRNSHRKENIEPLSRVNTGSGKANTLSVALQRFQKPTKSFERKFVGGKESQRSRPLSSRTSSRSGSRSGSHDSLPIQTTIERVTIVKNAQPKDTKPTRNGSCKLPASMISALAPKCKTLMTLCSNMDKEQSGLIPFGSLCAIILALTQDCCSALCLNDVEGILAPYRRVLRDEDTWSDYAQLVGDIIIARTPQRDGSADKGASVLFPSPREPTVEEDSPVPVPRRPLSYRAEPDHTNLPITVLPIRRSASPSLEPPQPRDNLSLEERVRIGRERISRLLKHELLDACGYDSQTLADALTSGDTSGRGYVNEKELRANLTALFRSARKALPPWATDRAVKMARRPLELLSGPLDEETLSPLDRKGVKTANKWIGAGVKLGAELCDVRFLLAQLGVAVYQ